MPRKETSLAGGNPAFPRTQWSVIAIAQAGDPQERRRALEGLIAAYWKPAYYFLRGGGYAIEDAKDLTQGFFAMLLEKDVLEGVSRGKTAFRTFLLVALKRFVSKERDRARALKRGGGRRILGLEFDSAEREFGTGSAWPTPEQAFAHSWYRSLLERAMARLERECGDSRPHARLLLEVSRADKPRIFQDQFAVVLEQAELSVEGESPEKMEVRCHITFAWEPGNRFVGLTEKLDSARDDRGRSWLGWVAMPPLTGSWVTHKTFVLGPRFDPDAKGVSRLSGHFTLRVPEEFSVEQIVDLHSDSWVEAGFVQARIGRDETSENLTYRIEFRAPAWPHFRPDDTGYRVIDDMGTMHVGQGARFSHDVRTRVQAAVVGFQVPADTKVKRLYLIAPRTWRTVEVPFEFKDVALSPAKEPK
ncbi:MAG: hypothetical protein HYY16_05395 [Planctomycetes bacterium]|nr:hypothetical protein [Planctomycetota bacterium]